MAYCTPILLVKYLSFFSIRSAKLTRSCIETFPAPNRGTGTGIASFFNRIAGLCAPIVAIHGSSANPKIPIYISGALMLSSFIAMVCLPIETRGRQSLWSPSWSSAVPYVPNPMGFVRVKILENSVMQWWLGSTRFIRVSEKQHHHHVGIRTKRSCSSVENRQRELFLSSSAWRHPFQTTKIHC